MAKLKKRSTKTVCFILILAGFLILFLMEPWELTEKSTTESRYSAGYQVALAKNASYQVSQPLKSDCILCHDLMVQVRRDSQSWNQEPLCGNKACHGAGHQDFQLVMNSPNLSFIMRTWSVLEHY